MEKLYALYRKLFPKEWKNSRASFQRTGYNEYHTEREFEFIELVSDRYFPLCTWLDWSDFRFDHIPIEPVNFDLCCGEYEWQEFRPCLQFGIVAFLWGNTDDEDWRDILAGFKVPFEALPPIENAAPPYAALNAGREDPKIRRFLHLIEFIFHDTGNPFIDTTYCQPVDLYEWTLENLEMLKSQYKAVNEHFASMASIEEDIERDALSTFKELIGLWNTGRLPAKIRQNGRNKRAGKPDDSHGLLINILADSELNHAETAFNF